MLHRLEALLVLILIPVVILMWVQVFKLETPNSLASAGNGQVRQVERPSSKALSSVVSKALEGTNGRYAIVIKNLKTGESFYQNETDTFEPGSIYKLWVMATVYQQIKDGIITPDQPISENVADLNQLFDIDPADAELTEGEVNFTVDSAVYQMITISHNYAALSLTKLIKNSNIKNFLVAEKFNGSDLGSPPKTDAFDIANFYEKLYKGEIIDPASSQKMIEILKDQQLNDGLPKNLPQEIEVAHKTGDIGRFKHDAGIVFTPDGDYIIVILSESDLPAAAQDRIASISLAVYNYFTKSPK